MAISVNWYTGVIYVPKDSTTLVQTTPTEIRELDLNIFRLTLKSLEDNPEGMPFLKTHNHFQPVTVSGVQLARVINILEPYTITFEDGQYAVNLVGANSNVGDRVNVNNVSVRSSNSAGLISNAAIEYASFNDGITIDVTSNNSGTIYPMGTPNNPVNNLQDAQLIAEYRGFNTLFIIQNITIESTDDISNYTIIGQGSSISAPKTTITLVSGCITTNAHYHDAKIMGRQGGESSYNSCVIGSVSNTHCEYINCALVGPNIVSNAAYLAGHNTDITNCYSSYDWYVLDMNNSYNKQIFSNYSGKIKIINMTNPVSSIIIRLNSGKIWFDSSCTDGDVSCNGIGVLINESTIDNFTQDGLINQNVIVDAIWNEPLANHISEGTMGLALKHGAVSTIRDPFARGGGLNYIILDVSSSTYTDAYNNALIVINSGIGEGQVRTILSYDGTTKIAYVNLNWVVIPDETSEFSILADDGPLTIVSGRIESSTNNTITLMTVSIMSEIDDIYNEALISISSGLNAGQTRRIVGFNADTRTITIHKPWTNNPTQNDTYQILPSASVTVNEINNSVMEEISDVVWNEPLSGHLSTGTTGKALSTSSSGGVDIQLLVDGIWNEAASLHTVPGSFGNNISELTPILKNILGLTQHNFKFYNQVYNANGDMITGNVRIFNNSSDCISNSNFISEYEISATYDVNNKLVDYKSILL